jgi:VCBS repeat-containing protein
MTKRAGSINFITGNKSDNHLQGTAGNDVMAGHQGDDWMQGGAGNDIVTGDNVSGGKHWGWLFGGCWHATAGGNDHLDGGAGSDLVLAGGGNDLANYTWSENLRAHDVYDGGKGFDTLQLTLTHGEYLLASVQADIAAFEAFLDSHANPGSDHGKTFEFKSFDLDARNFEAREVVLVNATPTAAADTVPTDEDTPLQIAAPGLLANDTDPDHLDVLSVTGADTASALGAAVAVGADGSATYDAGTLFQYLAAGESVTDSFDYTIADLAGAAATATVRVTVAGVNDAPVAADDIVAPAGGAGQVEEHLITFEGAGNPANVDGYAFAGFSIFSFAGVGSTFMAAASTGNDNVGGGSDADGAVRQFEGADFAVKSLAIAALSFEPTVTIVGYNDNKPVEGAQVSLSLNGGYTTIDFGPAWGSIDEVRFYGSVAEPEGDYLMIDNLLVSMGSGGASGHSEDAPFDINVNDLLSNDKDVDASDLLHVSGFSAMSKMGAAISMNDDGSLNYDPTQAEEIQALAQGETATDTFEYTVSDGHGGTDVASVSVALLGFDDLL